jgi:thymidine kinase
LTYVIYSRKKRKEVCEAMGRKSKEQLKQERMKKLQNERAKRYYEKQRQIGKVRIVKWVSQDEKQFLDELIFPNLPKLVKKWKAQQEK